MGDPCGRGRAVPELLAHTEHTLSKQNRICTLWWCRDLKSSALEFSVWCCLLVVFARSRLWFCKLACKGTGETANKGGYEDASLVRPKNISVLLCLDLQRGKQTHFSHLWCSSWKKANFPQLHVPHPNEPAFPPCTNWRSSLSWATSAGQRGSEKFKPLYSWESKAGLKTAAGFSVDCAGRRHQMNGLVSFFII